MNNKEGEGPGGGTPPAHQGVWGSAVSYTRGVWGGAPDANAFFNYKFSFACSLLFHAQNTAYRISIVMPFNNESTRTGVVGNSVPPFHCPPGHFFLGMAVPRTIFPRYHCPPGQRFLGKNVRGDIFA